MKNTGKCSKCNSTNILKIPGDLRSYGAGNNIITSSTLLIKAVKVTRYMCSDCGFSEEWIVDKKDIEKLNKTFG